MKYWQHRLRDLKFHVVFDNGNNNTLRRLAEDAIDWLIEEGPASVDWYVHEEDEHSARRGPLGSTVVDVNRKYTFAFKYAKDATLFKLMWHNVQPSLDPN